MPHLKSHGGSNQTFPIMIYTEPKEKLYTFIIQIANTILNQCISLCLYKIGHITKAIICLTFKLICHASFYETKLQTLDLRL